MADKACRSMSQRRMLILGGSTRAAADSVRRAGWQPVCADIFADLDLQATAEVIPTRHYPDSFPEDVAQVQADERVIEVYLGR